MLLLLFIFAAEYRRGPWRAEVSVLSAVIEEPSWDPSTEPTLRYLKGDSLLVHLTLQVETEETPII